MYTGVVLSYTRIIVAVMEEHVCTPVVLSSSIPSITIPAKAAQLSILSIITCHVDDDDTNGRSYLYMNS